MDFSGASIFLFSDPVLTMKLFRKREVPGAGAVLLVLYRRAMWLYVASPARAL